MEHIRLQSSHPWP